MLLLLLLPLLRIGAWRSQEMVLRCISDTRRGRNSRQNAESERRVLGDWAANFSPLAIGGMVSAVSSPAVFEAQQRHFVVLFFNCN